MKYVPLPKAEEAIKELGAYIASLMVEIETLEKQNKNYERAYKLLIREINEAKENRN